MDITKDEAKKLMERDFIPNCKPVDARKLTFRRTKENEVFRCCARTGYDSQSGPFFCGEIAEFVTFVETETKDGMEKVKAWIGLCGRRGHVPPNHLISPE